LRYDPNYVNVDQPVDAFFPHFDRGGLAGILRSRRKSPTYDSPWTPPSAADRASATMDEWGRRFPPAKFHVETRRDDAGWVDKRLNAIITSIKLVGDADVLMLSGGEEVILRYKVRYFHGFLND
jgi:hypothetical protein